MAAIRFYKDLKRLAKRANQRMVELERRGMKTPAYVRVQATLEMMGTKRRSATGRRFSETGKATYNQYQQLMKHINRFLDAETSTVSGTKKFYDKVWEGAKRNIDIEKYGINKEDYFSIWDEFKEKKSDRIFGSDTIIKMVSTALRVGRENKAVNEQRVTAKEIAKMIHDQSTVKGAYKALGITFKDMQYTNSLGEL